MATATSPSRKKTHVKKGDQVTVISGNFKGESGRVLQVLVQKDRVIVEGVRKIKKHAQKSQDRPPGGIIEREGPIHISNVRLVESAPAAEEEKPGKAKAAKADKPVAKKAKAPKKKE